MCYSSTPDLDIINIPTVIVPVSRITNKLDASIG